MEWRKKRFGFDPARYYYTLAQAGVLTVPASKDTGEALGKAAIALAQVIRYLDQCFSYDITYVKKVEDDPLFSQLIHYERRVQGRCQKIQGQHS
jgi:hypothetical protein